MIEPILYRRCQIHDGTILSRDLIEEDDVEESNETKFYVDEYLLCPYCYDKSIDEYHEELKKMWTCKNCNSNIGKSYKVYYEITPINSTTPVSHASIVVIVCEQCQKTLFDELEQRVLQYEYGMNITK